MYVSYKTFMKVPNLFDDFVLNTPDDINVPKLNESFEDGYYKTVVVTSKILFDPKDVGKKRGSAANPIRITITAITPRATFFG